MADKWYIKNGDQGDIVLSTGVRIARNLESFPFPCRLSADAADAVNRTVVAALANYQGTKLHFINMRDLTPHQAVSMAERHLISPEFTEAKTGRVLVLSENEDISIMLCGEDHIRIHAMCAGFAPDDTYSLACSVDDCLDRQLKYAFDERLGYLTQNPTGLGTAMCASMLLHLPALSQSWEISRLATTVSKLGLSIRGSYGDGSSVKGDIYMLSNQITLGISEHAALENLKAIALQLATKERAAREELEKNVAYMDKVHRAYGILSNARVITSDEMMELISSVRLGAVAGTVPVRVETVNELMISLQPATLNAQYGENMDSSARDALRADIIRARFAEDLQSINSGKQD